MVFLNCARYARSMGEVKDGGGQYAVGSGSAKLTTSWQWAVGGTSDFVRQRDGISVEGEGANGRVLAGGLAVSSVPRQT